MDIILILKIGMISGIGSETGLGYAGVCAHIAADGKQVGIIAKLDDQSAKRSSLKRIL